MNRGLPYLTSGLLFAAGCIWLAIPGPSKYIAAPIFFVAAVINLIAAQKTKK